MRSRSAGCRHADAAGVRGAGRDPAARRHRLRTKAARGRGQQWARRERWLRAGRDGVREGDDDAVSWVLLLPAPRARAPRVCGHARPDSGTRGYGIRPRAVARRGRARATASHGTASLEPDRFRSSTPERRARRSRRRCTAWRGPEDHWVGSGATCRHASVGKTHQLQSGCAGRGGIPSRKCADDAGVRCSVLRRVRRDYPWKGAGSPAAIPAPRRRVLTRADARATASRPRPRGDSTRAPSRTAGRRAG